MGKRQGGQAFILVLILLAIGALLVVPALRLTGTSLKSSQIVPRQTKALYVAEAAQEYVLWKLKQPGFASSFQEDIPQTFQFDACGVPVFVSVIMRAVEGGGGITLATDDVIKPTKTVSASHPVSPDTPDTIPNDSSQIVTYTIRLEQLSDNNTQGLDAIYDILPPLFDDSEFHFGECEMRVDGGAWQSIPDPALENPPTRWRLKWPADYDPDTGTGAFSSDPLDVDRYFHGIRDFGVRQVKELRFKMSHYFKAEDNNLVHCNWAVLKMGDITTVSGPQAPLTVGSPAKPGVCVSDGLIETDKKAEPSIIPPGVETDIEYTISMTNKDGNTQDILQVIDYLPPAFLYSANTTSGISIDDPVESPEEINGVERWKLTWEISPTEKSIASGVTKTLTFWATATKDVSGSYYNEVQVILATTSMPAIFSDIGITGQEYFTTYSWNTGAVMVPAYDSSTTAGGANITTNIALTVDGVIISSWQVD